MTACAKTLFRLFGCVIAIIVSQTSNGGPGVWAQKCSDLTSGLEITADWWSILPYATKSTNKNGNYTNIEGIFPVLLERLENRTGIKIRYAQPSQSYSNLTKAIREKDNSTLFFPVARENNKDDECFIPVMETYGPAYFIHIKEIVPLTLLGKGLLQGWQVIALTIVLAAISGIFIWIMDRNANPEDFPPAFIPGVWQGFWWAFVTMTTVGYGDTAPRSVPARLYSILWMIIGMIAFSVLTANITSSLSRQTFDEEDVLFGKKVGVLEGTMDAKAALMENANIINYNSVTELLSSMRSEEVDGILMERYVAGAYYNTYTEQGLELGTTLKFPYFLGLQAPSYIPGQTTGSPCQILSKCIEDILKEEEVATQYLTNLSKEWRSIKKADSVSLFEDESFFYILIAFFFACVGVGALWHYFVYLPKQRQVGGSGWKMLVTITTIFKITLFFRLASITDVIVYMFNLDTDLEAADEEQQKLVLLKKELEILCEECRGKVENILKENPDRNLQESAFPFGIPLATPNLKQLSTNALGQLKNMPSNAVGQLPLFGGGRRKSGRVA